MKPSSSFSTSPSITAPGSKHGKRLWGGQMGKCLGECFGAAPRLMLATPEQRERATIAGEFLKAQQTEENPQTTAGTCAITRFTTCTEESWFRRSSSVSEEKTTPEVKQ